MENKQEGAEKPALKILQELKEGQIDPGELSKEACIDCTEVLALEGYSKASIGQILNKSQKTIARYLEEVWRRNDGKPSNEAALRMIGELIQKSRAEQEHLIRLARSQEGSFQERIQAVYYAFRIHDGMISRLQTLGYLPLAPQKVIGDIYHHDQDEIKTLDQLRQELSAIEKIAEKDGLLDEAFKDKLRLLQFKIEKAEIAQDLVNLENSEVKQLKEEEETDGQQSE